MRFSIVFATHSRDKIVISESLSCKIGGFLLKLARHKSPMGAYPGE